MKNAHKADINVSGTHERRKRRRWYFIFGTIFLAVYVVLVGLAWLVFRSPIFRIQNITITGNERVKNDQVLSLLYGRIINGRFSRAIFGLNNILIWPKQLSEDDLRLLPTIKGLTIGKDFRARNIVVRVEEREPYGVWCFMARTDADQTQTNADQIDTNNLPRNSALSPRESAGAEGDNCWWFDKDGFIFQKSLSAEGGLITTINDYSQKGGGLNFKILPDEFIANAFSIFEVLKASGLAIKEIRLNDISLQEIEVDTYAGPKFYFSLRFPSTNDLQVIQSFLSKPGFNKLQYLDFRVENRAYYK
jgi:hypothetical protein